MNIVDALTDECVAHRATKKELVEAQGGILSLSNIVLAQAAKREIDHRRFKSVQELLQYLFDNPPQPKPETEE